MAQEDQRATSPGFEGAVRIQCHVKKLASNRRRNFIFDHTTQALEKLRNARGMDEIVAIQSDFVKEAFEHAAKHAQKFRELMTAFPAEMTKTYQDAWLKSVDSTVKATETANQTVVENIERFSEAARKASNVSDHRESA